MIRRSFLGSLTALFPGLALAKEQASEGGQPTPYDVMTSRLRFPGGPTVTAIVRFWRPGDKARCKLCPKCGSDPRRPGSCVVMVNRPVEKADAAFFSRHDTAEVKIPRS